MHLLRTMSGLWRNINERDVWRCKQIQQRNIHTFSKLKCWPAKKKKEEKTRKRRCWLFIFCCWCYE